MASWHRLPAASVDFEVEAFGFCFRSSSTDGAGTWSFPALVLAAVEEEGAAGDLDDESRADFLDGDFHSPLAQDDLDRVLFVPRDFLQVVLNGRDSNTRE